MFSAAFARKSFPTGAIVREIGKASSKHKDRRRHRGLQIMMITFYVDLQQEASH